MKKLILTALFASLALSLVTGCGVEEDKSYVPLEQNPHTFASPAVGNHDEYLRTHAYRYDQCTACHGQQLDGNGNAAMSCGKCHNDGAGHVTVTSCNFCHGNLSGDPAVETNWAPPRDLAGNLAVTARGVGRHQFHLTQVGPPQGPISCSGCHTVPARWDSPGHIDGDNRAEVSSAIGYDQNTNTCVICHGPTNHVWNQ